MYFMSANIVLVSWGLLSIHEVPSTKLKAGAGGKLLTVKCSHMQLTERVTCWACRMGARGLGCPPLQMCYVESKDSTSFRLCRKGNVREKCWSSSNPSSPLKTVTFWYFNTWHPLNGSRDPVFLWEVTHVTEESRDLYCLVAKELLLLGLAFTLGWWSFCATLCSQVLVGQLPVCFHKREFPA